MDNHFFRQCLPHRVECTDNLIRIFSQQPNKLLFEGILPKGFNKDTFFNSLASDTPNYIGSTICYLYDVNENPVSNMNGYDMKLMETYNHRLDVLVKFMRGIEPVFEAPNPPQN